MKPKELQVSMLRIVRIIKVIERYTKEKAKNPLCINGYN